MTCCASSGLKTGLLIVLSLVVFMPCPPMLATDVGEVERALLARAERNIEQCRKGPATVCFKDSEGRPISDAAVEIRQTAHEFLFGCIAFELVRDNDLYKAELWKQRFRELFNFAVFPFYWVGYERQPGTTIRDDVLEAVAWCKANGITTKGHPLVWTNPYGVPKWLQQVSLEKSEARMLERVSREAGGFAGQIDIWDVVNEPIHCRAWRNIQAAAYMREPIPDIADYVDKAFRAAHEANPRAHLILNEFYVIARKEDRERFYELVVELKRRGTPISGLGIQAHEPREDWFAPQRVWATLDRLGELGYPLHITEYIPQSGGKEITGGWREGTWTEEAQAEFAEQLYTLCFGHPAVVSINWWGLSDRRIWLPAGGLLRKGYEPKPVYNRLKDLIHSRWKTSIKTRTDENGRVAFRGFHGTYDISVTPQDGERLRYTAALVKGRDNEHTFTAD